MTALSPEVISTTVVSAMEQVRGRLAQVHRAKTPAEVVQAFARFQEALQFFRTVSLLPYDEAAAAQFSRLRQILPRRIGTQDLRIAAIALSRNATLVTPNQRDFQSIAELLLADWSTPST